MRAKLFGAAASVLLFAGGVVPLAASPAVADPACAMDVYGDVVTSGQNYAYKINVTLNRCSRPTKAIAECGALGGTTRTQGGVITRGSSQTEWCARNATMKSYGWSVYHDGRWNDRWIKKG